jgi:hypothetical protein
MPKCQSELLTKHNTRYTRFHKSLPWLDIVTTECFRDLGKLNFPMGVWFQAQANFQYCPAASKSAARFNSCQTRPKNNHLASLISIPNTLCKVCMSQNYQISKYLFIAKLCPKMHGVSKSTVIHVLRHLSNNILRK